MKTHTEEQGKVNLAAMADKWGSPFIARAEIGKLTGGILKPRTMANRDCQGVGIKERFVVDRRVCYPVVEVVKYLESRAYVPKKRSTTIRQVKTQ